MALVATLLPVDIDTPLLLFSKMQHTYPTLGLHQWRLLIDSGLILMRHANKF